MTLYNRNFVLRVYHRNTTEDILLPKSEIFGDKNHVNHFQNCVQFRRIGGSWEWKHFHVDHLIEFSKALPGELIFLPKGNGNTGCLIPTRLHSSIFLLDFVHATCEKYSSLARPSSFWEIISFSFYRYS